MDSLQVASFAAAVATTIAAGAVVVTATIYYGQLKAMKEARQLQSILAIINYLDDIDLRRARYFMFEHGERLRTLLDTPFSWDTRKVIDQKVRELSSGQLGLINIDLCLNSLNNICFLVRQGYAPPAVVDTLMKNSLLRAWYAFGPYIRHRRSRSDAIGLPSWYAQHIEWVAENMCKAH
ncbi:MAG: hypothetical protein HY236_00005 [Acidobacteria bacterium]|nr:hypothetical protein [Acidobacteriota bacterium]